MKKSFPFLIFLIPFFSFSQSGLESILFAVESDSKKIFNRYLSPLMNGAIYSSNAGWFNSAKVHKKLGFDLSLKLNISFVPRSEQKFLIDDLDYITTTATNLPTIIGDSREESLIVTIPTDGTTTVMRAIIKAPKGIKNKVPLGGVPAPVLQLGIGLPFQSEAVIRYSPEYHRKGIDMSLKGIGFKHNLMQYFNPFVKFPLNVSAFASFSKMEIDYDIQSFSSLEGKGQFSEFSLNNYNLLLICSVDLPIISFYGSFGYSGGSSSFNLKGEYNLNYVTDTNIPIQRKLEDPIQMSFNVNDFQTTFGVKYKFLIFNASLDYTFQNYNTISAGISANIR